MSELTETRWQDTKSALLEGLTGNRKAVMESTLENTKKYLAEAATAGATSAGNVAANEIVGVQPMTGPVGQIHTLRVRYASTNDATGTSNDVTAGDEALSPFKIGQAYSGDGTAGKADATASKDQAQQGIDVEAEIMAALAQEITAEIDQEIINSLRDLAATEETYNQAAVSGTATFVGDEHAALAVLINRVANKIAQRTRRGAGNYAVVTILQSATTSAFARTTEGAFEAPTNQKFVGTLNSAMKVYVDTYAADDTAVLVGYKGSSEADAAAFYCPYIPLMSSGVVLDPSTFEPVVSFMTRYGYVELSNTASSLGNAGDYVGEVAISNVSFA